METMPKSKFPFGIRTEIWSTQNQAGVLHIQFSLDAFGWTEFHAFENRQKSFLCYEPNASERNQTDLQDSSGLNRCSVSQRLLEYRTSRDRTEATCSKSELVRYLDTRCKWVWKPDANYHSEYQTTSVIGHSLHNIQSTYLCKYHFYISMDLDAIRKFTISLSISYKSQLCFYEIYLKFQKISDTADATLTLLKN